MSEELETLIQDAEALGKYYSKDFGTLLWRIMLTCDDYLEEQTEIKKERALRNFKKIKDFYETIPIEELPNDQRYAPLVVTNRLIPKLEEKMDLFFESTNEENFKKYFYIHNGIVTVGRLYRESFHKALRKVREHPEGKDYTIRLVGITGKVWKKYYSNH